MIKIILINNSKKKKKLNEKKKKKILHEKIKPILVLNIILGRKDILLRILNQLSLRKY